MNKSEFYKLWYTRQEDQELNEQGFPPILINNNPITTEEQWTNFIALEMDVEDFLKVNKEACELVGVQFVPPHIMVRQYPSISDQLDGIYKSLLAIKESGVDLGTAGDAYLDSITAVKDQTPKTHDIPAAPDPTQLIAPEVDPTTE